LYWIHNLYSLLSSVSVIAIAFRSDDWCSFLRTASHANVSGTFPNHYMFVRLEMAGGGRAAK
jgi:hypothetical protein